VNRTLAKRAQAQQKDNVDLAMFESEARVARAFDSWVGACCIERSLVVRARALLKSEPVKLLPTVARLVLRDFKVLDPVARAELPCRWLHRGGYRY
jgi:hypothetical protein